MEAQITGEDAVAGLQFEVTRRKPLENKVLIIQHSLSKQSQIVVDLEFTSFEKLSSLIESVSDIPVADQVIKLRSKLGKSRILPGVGCGRPSSHLRILVLKKSAVFKSFFSL